MNIKFDKIIINYRLQWFIDFWSQWNGHVYFFPRLFNMIVFSKLIYYLTAVFLFFVRLTVPDFEQF